MRRGSTSLGAGIVTPSRFRLSISDLLIGVSWIAIALTAGMEAVRLGGEPPRLSVWDQWPLFRAMALATLSWSSLFPAVGAFLGRTRLGMAVGAAVWSGLLLVSLLLTL